MVYFDVLVQYILNINPNDTVVVLDVDGLACDAYKLESAMSDLDYKKLKSILKCRSVYVKMIIFLIENNITFYLLTGRKEFVKEETEKMFLDVGLDIGDKIIYYPNESEWIDTSYYPFKLKKIEEISQKWQYTIFADDNIGLIDYLNEKLINKGIFILLPINNIPIERFPNEIKVAV